VKQVCILFKRKLEPDQELGLWLERELVKAGYRVFLDRRGSIGTTWAQDLERQLEHSDLVIILLSEQSAPSEMLAFEVEMADAIATEHSGRPDLMPVRLNLRSPLPETLSGILHHREFFWDPDTERHKSRIVAWRGPGDDQKLLSHILLRLSSIPAAPVTPIRVPVHPPPAPELEPLGGAVPLESTFYIQRPSDDEFRNAIRRHDSIVLVKGARQMGKTSLLARGLQHARTNGMRVVLCDLQKLHSSHLASQDSLFKAFAEMLSRQLNLREEIETFWNTHRSPNSNFERFWREIVFRNVSGPVLWALDEFDRIFSTDFGTEVCGLLRSWHNERALDPTGPWRDLTTAISFATEAHLFISDLNQSPFNVGTRITLSDFTLEQLGELNERYGAPIKDATELRQLHDFLGGHPYLCRCALQKITEGDATTARIIAEPDLDEGIFSDHLKRLLVSVSRDPAIRSVALAVAKGEACPTLESFYRLRTAGVVTGIDPSDAKPRCELYAVFLRRHLAPQPSQ